MREPLTVFCGYEEAEAAGFHVFVHGLLKRASRPVRIVPLSSMGLPEGSNSFTLSRFLVPWLMRFKGRAIFADASDMAILDDISKLDDLFSIVSAVQVVKHETYKTRHHVKYRGTALECPNRDYERKNWASLMLVNCEHRAWTGLTPERVASLSPLHLLQFQNLPDECIGSLPPEWNVLVDEGQEAKGAKILHWSSGIPGFPMYRSAPSADIWMREFQSMTAAMEGRY